MSVINVVANGKMNMIVNLDDDCPNCGTRHMSPVRSEDHPDYEPQEDKENKHD